MRCLWTSATRDAGAFPIAVSCAILTYKNEPERAQMYFAGLQMGGRRERERRPSCLRLKISRKFTIA